MLFITKIDTYRDGGTVGIFAIVNLPEFEWCFNDPIRPWITIDFSIGTATPGTWYHGWKMDGMMVRDDLKVRVLKEIQDRISHDQHIYDKIK